jgi:L-threonylcarbamoyladenylate synthase
MTPATLLTDDPAEAAAHLRAGRLVAFPTETVYGLGGDARNPEAVAGIFRAKGRPADNPLIVHLATVNKVQSVAGRISGPAAKLLEAFAPGPITIVLERAPGIPAAVSAGLSTVGIRVPAHPVAHAFLEACACPVAAPSANLSGRPSPTTWEAVHEDLDGRIDCILRGPRSEVGLESTVVDCTGDEPVLLRSGHVSLEAIRAVVPEARLARVGDNTGRSPGIRHRHYAPRARVRVVSGPREPDSKAAWIGLSVPPAGYGLVHVAADVAAYAHALYDFFRRTDAAGLDRIDCEAVEATGIGRALMDRIARAEEGTRT